MGVLLSPTPQSGQVLGNLRGVGEGEAPVKLRRLKTKRKPGGLHPPPLGSKAVSLQGQQLWFLETET